jgi:hypothetical protein
MPNLFLQGGLSQFAAGMWRFWPRREAGTFKSQTAPGTYTTQLLADPMGITEALLLFGAGSVAEAAPSGGAYTRSRADVLLPAQVITTAAEPKPGDQIMRAADSSTWTILDVNLDELGIAYKLSVVNLALAYGLVGSGTLRRAAPTANAVGLRVPNLAAYASAVPCRVQRTTGRRGGDGIDSPTIEIAATAYLGQQVVPLFGDVFDDGTNRYSVVGWQNPDRLDMLFQLDLVDLP